MTKTETVSSTMIDELKDLRRRSKQLDGRVDALQQQVREAKAREAELVAALAEREAQLVAGDAAAADVVAAEELLQKHRAGVARLEGAHGKVAAERATVGAEVQRLEREVERELQEKASEPHRKRAAQLVDEFVAAVIDFGQALEDRQAIAEQVAREFPRATSVPRPRVADLVDRIAPDLAKLRSRGDGAEAVMRARVAEGIRCALSLPRWATAHGQGMTDEAYLTERYGIKE